MHILSSSAAEKENWEVPPDDYSSKLRTMTCAYVSFFFGD